MKSCRHVWLIFHCHLFYSETWRNSEYTCVCVAITFVTVILPWPIQSLMGLVHDSGVWKSRWNYPSNVNYKAPVLQIDINFLSVIDWKSPLTVDKAIHLEAGGCCAPMYDLFGWFFWNYQKEGQMQRVSEQVIILNRQFIRRSNMSIKSLQEPDIRQTLLELRW